MAKLNITWPQFAVCNSNTTKEFEDMCRRLFTVEFLKGEKRPHADHNNAGVEVLPILEPERDDGQKQKRISFQSKYVDQPAYAYNEFKKSARKTAARYKGELDLVYLFCNKALTTSATAYKEIVKIHADAGIETIPISNDEVLDMVKDHSEIAEYYFQPRIIADTSGLQPTIINGLPIYVINANQISSSVTDKPENEELLKGLISEKLAKCKGYALAMELDALKCEVERLFSLGATTGELYYYQLLVLLHEGRDTSESIVKCDDLYRLEAEWLVQFYSSPYAVPAEEYRKHTSITQVFALDKLFTPEHWRDLTALYESIREDSDPEIHAQLDLYYGLSLLNLQNYEKADSILHNLYERTKERRILFYVICADIRLENSFYQSGMAGHHELLAGLIDQLDSLKELKQYSQQELFVSAIKMESFYHLGIADKSFLERAIDEYNALSEKTQKDTAIQFFYALCLELNGNRDKAINVYETLDWKNDLAVAERYLICLILAHESEKTIEVYKKLGNTSVRTEAVYLFALERLNAENYYDELRKSVEAHRDSLSDLFLIAYYIDNEATAKEVVIPPLKELVSVDALTPLLLFQKIEIVTFLAHYREIELMKTALDAIEDISTINSFVVGEIYSALFDIANKEYSKKDKGFDTPRELDAVERIADAFLSYNVFKKNFLQIKVLCAGAKKMPFSSLKYSKELFTITHDTEVARSIVTLLFERKETNPAEYAPYLEVLENSENPDHCMVVAYAMLELGREDIAEFFAYKALYFLDDKDDYSVYRNYFGFYNYNLYRSHADITIRSVKGGTVVTLEEDGVEDKPHCFDVCLDQESDFSDESNRSMGIEHLIPSNPDYIKLRGSGLGQILKLRDRKYKIKQILPRNQFGLGFIFRKIQEKPEMFKGAVWMISTENVDEMIKQIKALTDNSGHIQSLLSSYHFEDNEAGLPIDALTSGDYSRYIIAFKHLLFQKDEALYAGQPIYENEEGKKYVPGLATLVLLSILGRMDILEAFKSEIIIPETYLSFFQEEYSRAAGIEQVSPSSLYFVNDKPVITDSDKTIPEIWESIITFCQSCTTKRITDQERIDFKIADGMTGEQFIIGFQLSIIHLDALILSQRENATILCDDLFFRKVAAWIGLRNLNIVSLIQHYTQPDYVAPIIKELSKTNYIPVPLYSRDDAEFAEIVENLMDGKRKEAFYGEIINRYINIRDRLIRKYYGDDYIISSSGNQGKQEESEAEYQQD